VESTLDIVDLHIRILRPRLCIRIAVEVHGTDMVMKEAIQLLGIAVASARLRLIAVETLLAPRDEATGTRAPESSCRRGAVIGTTTRAGEA
jgi:hypothetical protein